jgi:solute:Na+ symporter, SSS family
MNQSVIIVCAVYLVILLAIALYSRSKIHNVEDFLVAGRSLSFPLASATLIATWFGAGTLLTVSDEIKVTGLSAALMDPIGASLCLFIAGAIFAKPLWDAKLYTLVDLFARCFDVRVEKLSAFIMVPTYLGWIAVQYCALAQFFHIFTGLDINYGIFIFCVIGTAYTYVGGFWSVALTDMAQLMMLLLGLVILTLSVLGLLGDGEVWSGLARLSNDMDPEKLNIFPYGTVQDFMDSLALLTIGSLGNIPGQDLCQRIFAAKSAKVAKYACYGSGVCYLVMGSMPVLMGLAGNLLLAADVEVSVIPLILQQYFSGPFVLVFVVVILSVVLSTIDSATLSPASVLAQNLWASFVSEKMSALMLNRIAILVVASFSLATAYMGENAYSLLESAYEMQFVGLFLPLVVAVTWKVWCAQSMLVAMLSAVVVWLFHFSIGWQYFIEPVAINVLPLPISLFAVALGFFVYWMGIRGKKISTIK